MMLARRTFCSDRRISAPAAASSFRRSMARTAALCLAWPNGETALFEGKVWGHLVWPPRGTQGFGYDPMFVPEGHTSTFGEMEPDAKHAISHRARAFALFARACLGGAD